MLTGLAWYDEKMRAAVARAEKAERERDEASARASLIDEAQDANAGLARLLAERDVKLATLRALIARAVKALEMGERLIDYFANNRNFYAGPGTPMTFCREARALAADLRKASGEEPPKPPQP